VGIYDRDYYRQERAGFSLAPPRSAVGILVLINVAVFLAEMIAEPQGGRFGAARNSVVYWLSAHVYTLSQPWLWWQFITYGFVHAPGSLQHILFNMLTLWFLGRDVEEWYGKKEFLRLYLVLLAFGALTWALANRFGPLRAADFASLSLFGASGAVAGIVVLYALNFPRRTLLVMFVLPMPAWLVGVLVVLYDVCGATGWTKDTHIAYTVHLAGAAFALLYWQQRWNFGRLAGRWAALPWPRRRGRPSLHIHQPEEEAGVPEEEVDRILEKIHGQGENSLTRKERRILENASREYQRRRRLDV
jgi:membrane associated rhomboid family serine protease